MEGREESSEKRQGQGKGRLNEGQKISGRFGDGIVGLRLLSRLDTRDFVIKRRVERENDRDMHNHKAANMVAEPGRPRVMAGPDDHARKGKGRKG